MMIIRPVKSDDLAILTDFAFQAASGMRNLPRNIATLKRKIDCSLQSFLRTPENPGKEEYLFVAEDATSGQVGGVAGILASTHAEDTFAFRIVKEKTNASCPEAIREFSTLQLVSETKNASELCSLYLRPEFRHGGHGRLLSLSRLLFMASHPERFRSTVIAELRGVIDEKQVSPFWNAIGSHFCRLSFSELMAGLANNTVSVREFLPKYPIYIDLLPENVREIIGQCHENTKPALHMLSEEGFRPTDEVDALEAGPTLESLTENVRSIRQSRLATIETVKEIPPAKDPYILATVSLHFRACLGTIILTGDKNQVIVTEDTADALRIKNGDTIRYVPAYNRGAL